MLIEIYDIFQSDPPYNKRWFHSADADLFIWELEDEIYSFQFCFQYKSSEVALSWKKEGLININQVYKDNHAHGMIGMDGTELIMNHADCDMATMKRYFLDESQQLSEDVINTILNVFDQYMKE